MDVDLYMARCRVEAAEQWVEKFDQIPELQFPPTWKVRIIPPSCGALVRFRIGQVSVYLDWFDRLGCVGQPYWELHPNPEGGCDRFLLHETDELIAGICTALEHIDEK